MSKKKSSGKMKRKSSPAGMLERLEARRASYAAAPADIRETFIKPGSLNPRRH